MPGLIPRLHLQDGETVTGYVSRYAARLEVTPRDFCSDLSMRWPFLCSGREDQLRQLAYLTDQSAELLLFRRSRKISARRFAIGGTVASTDVFRRALVRFCPACAYERMASNDRQPVQMLEWSLLCIGACPIHHCSLVSLSPVGSFHEACDFVGQMSSRKREILSFADNLTPLPVSSFEAFVRHRIWNGPLDDWLCDLDVSDLNGACVTLGASLAGLRVGELRQVPEKISRELVEKGFGRLVHGKESYLHALKERYGRGIGRPFPESDFGAHYAWLKRNAWRKEVYALVQIAREYILDTYPVAISKNLLGEKPRRKKLLTVEEARIRSGFGSLFLKKLIGYVEGKSELEALRETDVRVDALERAESYWATLANLSDAASQLGILSAQVRKLQDRKVLGLIRISSTLRYTLQADVDSLLKELLALDFPPACVTALPLRQYCRVNGIQLVSVVELWSAGKLGGAVYRTLGTGLQALAIRSGLTLDRVDTELLRDLELPATARYLKINVLAIRRLRDDGYLTEVRRRNPDTSFLKGYITRDSLLRFESLFVTLGQVASLRGIAPMHLARQLDREGMHPVLDLGPGARVYDRSLMV